MYRKRELIHERLARSKAVKVARYYYAHLSLLGKKPTLEAIGKKLNRSGVWASVYLDLAWRLGLIETEDDGYDIPS